MPKALLIHSTVVLGLVAATSRADVAPTGDFTSAIAIETPTFRGITAPVSLAYASGGNDGIAGVGWRLEGASTISRTSPTRGIARLAPLAGDRFFLDGEELVPCAAGSSSPSCTTALRGVSNGFYSTRRESFQRIEHSAATPQSWTVWRPDGYTRRYDTLDNGRSWQLVHAEDRHGNAVEYAYNADHELESIRYGDYGSRRGAEIRFYYEQRPDPRERGDGEAGMRPMTTRLRSIVVRVGGALARAYALSYAPSSVSRRSILVRVQQHGRDATVDATGAVTVPGAALPPTTFTAESATTPAPGWTFAPVAPSTGMFALPEPSGNPAPAHFQGTTLTINAGLSFGEDQQPLPHQVLTGDFDGDGRADVAVGTQKNECVQASLRGVLARKGGSVTVTSGIPQQFSFPGTRTNCSPRFMVGDIDGDHRDDIVYQFRDKLFTARLVGSQFQVMPASDTLSLPTSTQCAIGDIDGDGRGDIVCLSGYYGSTELFTMRGHGDGTFDWARIPVANAAGYDPMTLGDVNGDGFTDVIIAGTSGWNRYLIVERSNGNGTYTLETEATTWAIETGDSLLTADVDGDGLSDVILTRSHTPGTPYGSHPPGGIGVSAVGITTGRFELRQFGLSWLAPYTADVNGDGKTDIVNSTDLTVSVASGQGSYASGDHVYNTSCESPMFADTDGDGRDDAICTAVDLWTDPDVLIINDFMSTRAPRQPYRWLGGDFDGDGRGDFAYVSPRNPGIAVATVLMSDHPRRVPWSLAPSATVPGLDDSSTARWMVADVGSPGGPADGKDDLIMIDTDGGTLRMYALLSNGDGTYAPVADWPWTDPTTHARVAYDGGPLSRFMPVDIDGDGDTDLVHFAASGGGVQVEWLAATGGGHWARVSPSWTYSLPYAPQLSADFQPAEVNGDGLTDFIEIKSGPGIAGTRVCSLINTRGGMFDSNCDDRGPAYADNGHWTPMDVNGDGITDLVHVRSSVAGTTSQLVLDTLVARGAGLFTPVAQATAPLNTTDPELAGALEATSSLYPADLDGDGLTDLVHVSRYRDAAGGRRVVLARVMNPGTRSTSSPTWSVVTDKVPTTSLASDAAWGWRSLRDVNHPGSVGFIDLALSTTTSILYQIPSDRVVRIDNGNGGLTDVHYAGLLGHRDYLPSGMLPIVTTSVTRTDLAYTPPLTETQTYGFSGARWSDAERQLRFAAVATTNAKLATLTQYTTDDVCPGTQLSAQTIDAATGEELGFEFETLVGTGSAAPYTCLAQERAQYACKGANNCKLQTDTWLDYDGYGNTTYSGAFPRDAATVESYAWFYPNADAYVVNLPAFRVTYGDGQLLHEELYRYDNSGNPSATVDPLGEVRFVDVWDDIQLRLVTTKRTYDAQGLLVRTTDPDGGWNETTYDLDYHAFAASTCDPIGCTQLETDPVTGKLETSTDLNGAKTEMTYDAHGRLTETKYADGAYARTRLLDVGRVTGAQAQRQRMRIENSDGSSDGVLWTEQFLDGWGRTYRVEHEGGAAQVTEYSDLSGRPARVSYTFDRASSPQRFTEYHYDALGRLVEQVAPDGSSQSWTFLLDGVQETDQMGRVRTLTHDGNGQIIKVTASYNGIPSDTRYGYDGLGRLIGTTDAAGLVTSYYYNTLGQMIGESDPDRGLREYIYRATGGLEHQVDAKGQSIDFTYDGAGRPVTREDRDLKGTLERSVRWTYDYDPATNKPAGASLGKLVRAEEDQPFATLSSSVTYDVRGRVTSDSNCVDGTCYDMSYAYDPAGRLDRLGYPDGEVVDHTYDDAGHLSTVGGYVKATTYELDGALATMELGNGISTEYHRNPDRRWLDSVTIGTFFSATYSHDLAGRITGIDENTPTDTDSFGFAYDDAGRLAHVYSTDATLARYFTYDAIGRIVYSSQLGDYHYTDPAHPHAVTKTDFGAQRAYDANGNAVFASDPKGRYMKLAWTVDDHPLAVDNYTFAYDASGRRVKKDGPGDSGVYPNRYVAVENGRTVKYYFAGDRLVARNDGDVAYYHEDHTHSTRVETDAKGNVANAYQYDVHGNSVKEKEAFDDNIGFGGVHGEQALQLVYMGARYYDPVSARFLSADSVVRKQYATQSMDRYAFVENDPVNYIDPTGHQRSMSDSLMEGGDEARAMRMQDDSCEAAWCSGTTASDGSEQGRTPPPAVAETEDNDLNEDLKEQGEEAQIAGGEKVEALPGLTEQGTGGNRVMLKYDKTTKTNWGSATATLSTGEKVGVSVEVDRNGKLKAVPDKTGENLTVTAETTGMKVITLHVTKNETVEKNVDSIESQNKATNESKDSVGMTDKFKVSVEAVKKVFSAGGDGEHRSDSSRDRGAESGIGSKNERERTGTKSTAADVKFEVDYSNAKLSSPPHSLDVSRRQALPNTRDKMIE